MLALDTAILNVSGLTQGGASKSTIIVNNLAAPIRAISMPSPFIPSAVARPTRQDAT
jgi:hypothetical protein